MVSVMTYKEQLAEQDAMIDQMKVDWDRKIAEFFATPNKSWKPRKLTSDEFDDDQFRDENGDERIY